MRRAAEVGGDQPLGVARVGRPEGASGARRSRARRCGRRTRPSLRPLLDEQDGDAALPDPGERLEDDVDQLRRERRARARRAAARPAGDQAHGRSRAAAAGRPRAPRPGAGANSSTTGRGRGPSRRQLLLRSPRAGRAAARAGGSPRRSGAAKIRRPSGTSAIPSARWPRAPAASERPRSGTRRRDRAEPMIACRVVDLPRRSARSARRSRPWRPRGRARGRRHGAVANLEPVQLQQRGHRAAPPTRRGTRRPRRGCPDLLGRPFGQRPALVEHLDPVADVEDQRHVVVDQEDAGAVLVAHRADDLGELRHLRPRAGPAAGSSSSRNAGSVASARATPSRRSSPCAQGAGRLASAPSQRRAARAARRRAARASRGRGADAERGDLDVLAHAQARERVGVLERARDPARPRRCGLHEVIVLSSSSTRPADGRPKPVSTLTSVVLPRRSGRSARRPRARELERDLASAWTPSKARETPAARRASPGHRFVDCVFRRPRPT